MIVRHGRVVASWGNIDQRFDMKSTTKSMGGIALGLAFDNRSPGTHRSRVDQAARTLARIRRIESVSTGWLPKHHGSAVGDAYRGLPQEPWRRTRVHCNISRARRSSIPMAA